MFKLESDVRPQAVARALYKIVVRKTRMSIVDNARRRRNYKNVWSNSSVLRRRLNDVSDGTTLNKEGRAFQACAAAKD